MKNILYKLFIIFLFILVVVAGLYVYAMLTFSVGI
jgi:hypothetical protein